MNRRLSYAEWGELVRRAQTGEEKAFEELYYASYDYLYTVCFKSGVPEEEIGDVLQDTYLKIFKNLGSINDPERFLPWASMIAKNMGRDRGRQRKNYYEHNDLMGDTSTEEEQGIDTLATDEMDPCYSPEAALDRAATSKIVSEMIAELPEGQRNCIILWCNGWSTSDIASELGIPEGTAKTRIFQAKKKIEKKTLEVEKRQGIRLHTVAPISFFIWSIRNIHRILDIAPADFSGIRSELMASGQIAAHGTSMAQGTSMSGGYYGQAVCYWCPGQCGRRSRARPRRQHSRHSRARLRRQHSSHSRRSRWHCKTPPTPAWADRRRSSWSTGTSTSPRSRCESTIMRIWRSALSDCRSK